MDTYLYKRAKALPLDLLVHLVHGLRQDGNQGQGQGQGPKVIT